MEDSRRAYQEVKKMSQELETEVICDLWRVHIRWRSC